jgi:hypothetical protein
MLTNLFENINHTANIIITSFGENLPRIILNNIVDGSIPHSQIKVFGPFNQKQKRVIYDTRVEARNYHDILFTSYNEEINAEHIDTPIDFLVIPDNTTPNLIKIIENNISLIGTQRFILVHRDKSKHEELFNWVKNTPLLKSSKVYSSNNFAYIKVKTSNKLKVNVIKDPGHLWA